MTIPKTSENYAPSEHYREALKQQPAPQPAPAPQPSKSDFAMLCFG